MLVLPMAEGTAGLNAFSFFYWNHAGLEMNRATHSLSGPHGGPTMSSRALGLLHLAIHDAWFATLGHDDMSDPPTYLANADRPALPAGVTSADAEDAMAGAAIAMLTKLYDGDLSGMSTANAATLRAILAAQIAGYSGPADTNGKAHLFGAAIAKAIHDRLAVQPGQIGAGQGNYKPDAGRFKFRDEPINPVSRMPIDPNNPAAGTKAQRTYHAPFYGTTVPDFAVTDPDGHKLAHWPEADYAEALREVVRLGGAPGQPLTARTPDETVAAYFWAYDGANLIGTPPRLYNQILREVAWSRRDPAASTEAQTSEFVRLFALANTAMADAGKFAWKEKYEFELLRPLSGVREHDLGGSTLIDPDADPFWISLGAPETNTNRISFKPPFPAYPSGHATFGAACFQMARLFYKDRDMLAHDDNGPDAIGFTFVSEELNGKSRDLHQAYDASLPIEDQPGIVRTRVTRRFDSLWAAIFENAFSRIWLGVHWRFDAADAADMQNPDGSYRDPADISYSHVWTAPRAVGDPLPIGGVPLGLGIANDIYGNAMRAPAAALAAAASEPAHA